MKGKIVLIPFPFTDLSTAKLRPAVVLHEGRKDVMVAFISSQIPEAPSPSDVIITKKHPEFKLTGLKTDSVVKLDKLATLLKDLVLGELGELGKKLRTEINAKLEVILKV
jgi:mRNA interferase MazF